MTKSEVLNGYQTEIAYQKHMIENLGRWLTLLFFSSKYWIFASIFLSSNQSHFYLFLATS